LLGKRRGLALKGFNSHGKIYEASASKMFNVPIESVTKAATTEQRKVAEFGARVIKAPGTLRKMGMEKWAFCYGNGDSKKSGARPTVALGRLEACAMINSDKKSYIYS
jgi:hypothetical protein